MSSNTSDQTILFQLCGDCPICTINGVKAGLLRLPKEDSLQSFNQTDCSSFTSKQLQNGLVVFQHFYSAGLERVVFNLTVTNYRLGQAIEHQFIQLYAQPFAGNFTLLTNPRFLLKEREMIEIDSHYLSFDTNFINNQHSNLSYRVLNYTQYGILEVFEDSQWVSILERLQQPLGTFTQIEINTRKVRYRQTVPLLDKMNVTDILILQVYSFQLNGSEIACTFFILSLTSSPIKPHILTSNMTTTNFSLEEGKEAFIDGQLIPLSFSLNNSIQLSLSHKQFNVTVTIAHQPLHGILHFNTSSFNYHDLLSNGIIYTHDGSDTMTDTVLLKLTITSVTTQALLIPEPSSIYHVLHFDVNPVNDNYPQLIQHHSISPLEGSYITLNSSFFEITDSDHQNIDFLIVVGNDTFGSGHFAKQNLDKKLNRFYMSEVQAKQILYTFPHLRSTEVLNYYHNITISDGLHTIKDVSFIHVFQGLFCHILRVHVYIHVHVACM